MSTRPLTQKEKKFIQEYLIDLNATQAAIRAGYSKDSAANIGGQNVRKPLIQSAIFTEMDKRMKRTNITQDQIIIALKRIAFANIADLMTWNDASINIAPSDQLKRSKTYAISEISENVNQHARTVKVKLKDSIRALELLAKHAGMFIDRSDPTTGLHINKEPLEPKDQLVPAMTKEAAEAELKKRLGQS